MSIDFYSSLFAVINFVLLLCTLGVTGFVIYTLWRFVKRQKIDK